MKYRWIARVRVTAAALTLGAIAICAVPVSDASSQVAQSLKPPRVEDSDDPPTIRMYLVTALLGGLVVGANLIPSKRGHQD